MVLSEQILRILRMAGCGILQARVLQCDHGPGGPKKARGRLDTSSVTRRQRTEPSKLDQVIPARQAASARLSSTPHPSIHPTLRQASTERLPCLPGAVLAVAGDDDDACQPLAPHRRVERRSETTQHLKSLIQRPASVRPGICVVPSRVWWRAPLTCGCRQGQPFSHSLSERGSRLWPSEWLQRPSRPFANPCIGTHRDLGLGTPHTPCPR